MPIRDNLLSISGHQEIKLRPALPADTQTLEQIRHKLLITIEIYADESQFPAFYRQKPGNLSANGRGSGGAGSPALIQSPFQVVRLEGLLQHRAAAMPVRNAALAITGDK